MLLYFEIILLIKIKYARVECDNEDNATFYNTSLDRRDYSLRFSRTLIIIKSRSFRVSYII